MSHVSVIINCFNGESFLREALVSVVAQTFKDWEIILWDNRSTDHSKDIFLSFQDERFKYFLAPEHTNLGHARASAIKEASGEWIAFLDCDDIWYSGKLACQLEAAESYGDEVGLVYCDTDFVRIEGDHQYVLYNSKQFYGLDILPEGRIFNVLSKICFFTLASALFKKSELMRLGGINPELKHAEDYDIFLKIAFDCNVVAVQDVYCAYRLHDNNSTWGQHHLAYLEPLQILQGYANRTDIREAVTAWKVGFALWALRHRSFRFIRIWSPAFLSPNFLPEAINILRRKLRQWRQASIRKRSIWVSR